MDEKVTKPVVTGSRQNDPLYKALKKQVSRQDDPLYKALKKQVESKKKKKKSS